MNSTALSKQQYKCLYFLSQGMTYKEIALEMKLSPRTIEYYIEIIRKKTNRSSRRTLISFFWEQRFPEKVGMYA